MMNKLRNDKGLTLVELLATLVIGAIVISLVMGIHISIQKQYKKQEADIGYFLDVTTAAKAITKDIRKATKVELLPILDPPISTSSEIRLTWRDDTGTEIIREYKLAGNVVNRDGGGYISETDTFTFVESDSNGNTKIDFIVKSESGKQIATEIILR